MDPDPPSSAPRKVKFAPKALAPRRKAKLVIPKTDEDDKYDTKTQQSLVFKANDHLARKGPKVETKSSVQVAFSHGVASTGTTTFGRQREGTDDHQSERANNKSDAAYSTVSPLDEMQKLSTSLSNAGTEGVGEDLWDLSDAVIPKKKREYQDPWDYEKSYYPVTLPLRRPYSGNPEVLDKAEFEEALEYDENSVCCASDLGLQEQDETLQMLLFKFPSKLPLGSRKGKEVGGSSKNAGLEELGEGYMGKMLVYKSGAVKLKVGDILYDVCPGSECSFPQSVMAINTKERQCCELGTLKKSAVVTPDIDSLLQND